MVTPDGKQPILDQEQPMLPGLEIDGQPQPFDPVLSSGQMALIGARRSAESEEENPRAEYVMGPGGETNMVNPPRPKGANRKHYSHSGGRGRAEVSGRDVSRMIANADESMAGVEAGDPMKSSLYVAEKARIQMQADSAMVGGDPGRMLALSQTRDLRKDSK